MYINKVIQALLFYLFYRNTSSGISQIIDELHLPTLLIPSLVGEVFFTIYVKMIPHKKVTISIIFGEQYNTPSLHFNAELANYNMSFMADRGLHICPFCKQS